MGRSFGKCARHHGQLEAKERLAVFLDLENLVLGDGDQDRHLAEVLHMLDEIASRGRVVAAVASCHRDLAPRTAFELARRGVRLFTHQGGPDAADRDLIARMRAQLPASTETVVICSGDHIFAGVARDLRALGKRVEVQALFGRMSSDLLRAADSCRVLMPA